MLSGLFAPLLSQSCHLSVLHSVPKYLVQLSQRIPGTDCIQLIDTGTQAWQEVPPEDTPTLISAISHSSS